MFIESHITNEKYLFVRNGTLSQYSFGIFTLIFERSLLILCVHSAIYIHYFYIEISILPAFWIIKHILPHPIENPEKSIKPTVSRKFSLEGWTKHHSFGNSLAKCSRKQQHWSAAVVITVNEHFALSRTWLFQRLFTL